MGLYRGLYTATMPPLWVSALVLVLGWCATSRFDALLQEKIAGFDLVVRKVEGKVNPIFTQACDSSMSTEMEVNVASVTELMWAP